MLWSQFPHITMHWITEVKMAKSTGDLMTSRSISGRTDVPDYDFLDAKIASALKKLITNMHFRRRVCTEDLRAQNETRFLRGGQIAFMICEHFRATGAYDAAQGLSDLFNARLQNDDVQDFDPKWDQALLSASEVPTDMVLEGEKRNYSRWKIAVRRNIDQQMRTRNFRAWNEIVERGAVTKRLKGRRAVVERKVGGCCQWKASGQCSRGRILLPYSRASIRKGMRPETRRTDVLSRTKSEGTD